MNPLNLPAALMARLTYARKFALLGLVLLAPAAFALHAYWAVQGDTLAFADSERVGVRYLAPANELALRVISARGVAVRASTGDAAARAALPKAIADVRSAVAGVDQVDKADGAAINMNAAWREARSTIVAARDAKGFDAAATAAVGADRVRRRRLQADPRPGPRLLLRDGHAHHEAAGHGRQRRARGRPAGRSSPRRTRWTSGSRWPAPRARCARRPPRWAQGCRPPTRTPRTRR